MAHQSTTLLGGCLLALLTLVDPVLSQTNHPTAAIAHTGLVALSDHVPPLPPEATRIARDDAEADLTLTFLLNRDDEAAFQAYLNGLYDPQAFQRGRFLTAGEQAKRFGPAIENYQRVADWLQVEGFTIVQESKSRQLITARGSRAAGERALNLEFLDFEVQGRAVFVNNRNPELPADIAPLIQAISGLNSLNTIRGVDADTALTACGYAAVYGTTPIVLLLAPELAGAFLLLGAVCVGIQIGQDPTNWANYCSAGTTIRFSNPLSPIIGAFCAGQSASASGSSQGTPPHNPPPAPGGSQKGASPDGYMPADGTGQTVAITSFSDFSLDDVRDYLALMSIPPERINQLSKVSVNGGAPVGPDQTEVLLDIAGVWGAAPGADIVVYHTAFAGANNSFQPLFAAMIDDGVDIITNSFAYCEDQTTLADVQSIDTILQTAAAAGISVFSASGDTGDTCLNGAAATLAVPSSAPHLVSVGGSRLTFGPAFTYGSEAWWDGSSAIPTTGQGGFGQSRFFGRPAYQDGINLGAMRSVPDVVANADPATGFLLCQASNGGCPNGRIYGGTSVAAPIWAGFTAMLNQARGQNLGFLNPLLYPLAGTDAFHDATELGSNFDRVGLGSPNLDIMFRLLESIPQGQPDPMVSEVYYGGTQFEGLDTYVTPAIPADGQSAGYIAVIVRDADGHTVSGVEVSLSADSAEVTIEPASAVSSVADGSAVFRVTSLTPEAVMFTARQTGSGTEFADTPHLVFGVPAVATAGISAFPTVVDANGSATTQITVTLEDGLGRPAPNKQVRINQGSGLAVVSTADPGVTDANGQIVFTATNVVEQTVEFTATIVNERPNRTVPGNATVSFENGGPSCIPDTLPLGMNGFTVESFATGFELGPLSFGSVNFGNCLGAGVPTFVGREALIPNPLNGDVFNLPALEGGAATVPVSNLGPTLWIETTGKDGRLYARRIATTGNFNTGAIFELDPDTGEVLRTVADNLRCPHSLATDPLSGDLFFDVSCFGAGSDGANVFRVRDPAGPSPVVEPYAVLPRTPNGIMSFAPDGTLFVVTGYTDSRPQVVRVAGTDQPSPPLVEAIDGLYSFFWVTVVEADSAGRATTLAVLQEEGMKLVDLAASPVDGPVIATDLGPGPVGPDGCLYASASHTIYRLRDPDGDCTFLTPTGSPALRLTVPGNAMLPQGSVGVIQAQLDNVDTFDGLQVSFQTQGANQLFSLSRIDQTGTSVFEYTGINQGIDQVTAQVVLPDGQIVESNQVTQEWTAGQNVSALSLNEGPDTAFVGTPIVVSGTLVSVSELPVTAVVGETLDFALGSVGCSAVTDNAGRATCTLSPAQLGTLTLNVSYAGSSDRTGAEASRSMQILDPDVLGEIFSNGFEALFAVFR